MNFTYNNHLVYSLGGRPFGYRESPTDKFKVQLGQIDFKKYKKSNYANELHRTARLVRKEFGKNLVVFLSGGTDSEIVVRNFIKIGHKPRCVTIKFENDYNINDVKESEIICRDLGLDLTIIDFNLKNFFLSGEAKEFGEKLQCTQITYLMVYYNILKLSEASVMGGEALLTRYVDKTDSYWYYTFRENEDASAMRFSLQYGIPLVNEWFSYTPELLLYYLELEEIQNLVNNRYNYKLTSVSSKNDILKKLYPSVRQKKKTHGFEDLLGFNYECYKAIGADQIKKLEPSLDGIPVKDAIKQLKGEYEDY